MVIDRDGSRGREADPVVLELVPQLGVWRSAPLEPPIGGSPRTLPALRPVPDRCSTRRRFRDGLHAEQFFRPFGRYGRPLLGRRH